VNPVRKPIVVVSALVVGMVVAGWIAMNPGGRFGMSASGLTIYNRLPLPFVGLQVRSDGAMRVVEKVHKIGADELAWLATPEPAVLIIAGGWQGDARAVGQLEGLKRTKVLTLRTGEALALFNSLREQGIRVAIHVHPTC
jgi:hypothetical protein